MRRNSSPSPTSSLGERYSRSYSSRAARVLVLLAFLAALFFLLFIRIPGEKLLIWNWLYIPIAALPPILLLAALAVKLYQRIDSSSGRIICVAIISFIVVVIMAIVYSVCFVYVQYGTNPAAFYTDQETGNRLVIMKAVDMDKYNEDPDNIQYIYGAYPMQNKYFYYPERGETVSTQTGVDYVEWSADGTSADVHIIDVDGVEQVLTVDFSQLK